MRAYLLTFVGAALIVVGVIAFAYRGIPYTSTETLVGADSPRTAAISRKIIPMSPLLIGFVLVGGAALLAVGAVKSS